MVSDLYRYFISCGGSESSIIWACFNDKYVRVWDNSSLVGMCRFWVIFPPLTPIKCTSDTMSDTSRYQAQKLGKPPWKPECFCLFLRKSLKDTTNEWPQMVTLSLLIVLAMLDVQGYINLSWMDVDIFADSRNVFALYFSAAKRLRPEPRDSRKYLPEVGYPSHVYSRRSHLGKQSRLSYQTGMSCNTKFTDASWTFSFTLV